MSVSYEDAVSTLQSMFPSWDKGTLEIMLQENGNYVERTIDAIFMIENSSNGSNASGNQGGPRSTNLIVIREDDEPLRGTKCKLPKDFLRPPAMWTQSSETFGDEQLAILLQNEMFQREVHSTLGSDFMSRSQRNERRNPNERSSLNPIHGYSPSGTSSGLGLGSGMSSDLNGTGSGNSYPRSMYSPSSRQVQGGADLGIMKSISSMSVAARRNLNNLALQFSKHTQADHGSSEERDRLVTDEGFTRSPFLNDDDRDDDEVITFEGNPSSTLPRGTQRHTLSDDFVETNTNRRNKTSAEMISPNKKQH